MLRISDCIADRVRFAVPQPPEWQCIGDQIDAAMIFARSDFVEVHSGFRETDNFRFQFLLGFAPGHEFLHCGGHYFFDGPSILIRDLSQQSHRPLRESIHWPAANCEGCDVLRRFRDRCHVVRFALLFARAQETSVEQLCDQNKTKLTKRSRCSG